MVWRWWQACLCVAPLNCALAPSCVSSCHLPTCPAFLTVGMISSSSFFVWRTHKIVFFLSLHPSHLFFPPPFLPTAFGFLFSDKCGFSTERLILNERRDSVENVAGTAFLLAADRVQTGSYIGLDYIIGDTGISQGRYAKNCLHCLGHCAKKWCPAGCFICF